MRELSEDLAFTAKPLQHILACGACPDDLDGDLCFVGVIRTHGEIDRAQASVSDLTHDAVRADVFRKDLSERIDSFLTRLPHDEIHGPGEAAGFFARNHESLDFVDKTWIVGATGLEVGLAISGCKGHRLLEELLESLPPVGGP